MAGDRNALFDRIARLTIVGTSTPENAEKFGITEDKSGVQIDSIGGLGQRIQFEIERNLSKRANPCKITISNLNEETRTMLKARPLRVKLQAGYRDNFSEIFSGDVTYGLSTLDGPDWKTEFECGDGDRVIAGARISKSYKPGTKVGSVLEDLANSAKQQLPEAVRNSEVFKKVLNTGFVAFGKYEDKFEELLKPYGYSMSIQDGQPQVVNTRTGLAFSPARYLIDERHGMIGSPEFGHPDKKGKAPPITVNLALYPAIRPGHIAEMSTRDLNGSFKIIKVKHKGDTHGNEWQTEIEIEPTDAKSKKR